MPKCARSVARALLVISTASVVAGGCTIGNLGNPENSSATDHPASVAGSTSAPSSGSATLPPNPSQTASPTRSTVLTQLAPPIAADSYGLAVGSADGSGAATAGTFEPTTAWSSIKVPLAIAAMRQNPTIAQPLVERAITNSDNAAAQQLWDMLGSGSTAAAKVQQILREGHDNHTVVQPRDVLPGFTAFGQTPWTLTDQAIFAAHLRCISDSEVVRKYMGQIQGAGKWGLADVENALSKGGWGPGISAGHLGPGLVRQFGVIPTEGGKDVAVAFAVPGTLPAAGAAMMQIAQWLAKNKSKLPSSKCE